MRWRWRGLQIDYGHRILELGVKIDSLKVHKMIKGQEEVNKLFETSSPYIAILSSWENHVWFKLQWPFT